MKRSGCAPATCWIASRNCGAANCWMNRPPRCWSAHMSELVKRLWLGVTLILATSAFLLLSDTGQRAAGALPRVAVLQFSSMQALDDGAHGLLDALRDQGYDGTHKAIIERF